MPRPYVAWSIERLEALLESHGRDQRVLSHLGEELSFRKTNRARRLLAQVADSIGNLEADGGEVQVPVELVADKEPCDDCGRPMVLKRGRFGTFYACSGYPGCKATRRIAETDNKQDKPLGENSPQRGGEVLTGEDQEQAEPSVDDLSENSEAYQMHLWSGGEAVEREQPPDDRRRPTVLSSIRPVGTSGLPPPWSRPLDGNRPLSAPSDSDLPQLYMAALSVLIDEIKQTGAGQKRYELEKGIRAEGNTDGILYGFVFVDAADLFEDAKVAVELPGRRVAASIISISSGRIWLSTGRGPRRHPSPGCARGRLHGPAGGS